MSRALTALALLLSVVLVAACGGDDESSGSSSSSSEGTSSSAAADCQKDSLKTVADGRLTVATDKPAFPPYFVDDDPTNGKGFESAVAYAIGEELGFERSEVEWTVVPFNSSYAPGPKDFDFDVNQISITPAREKQVDFSAPYFTAPQAVLALEDSPAADAKSLADLKDTRFGVQVGTTSLDAVAEVIQPDTDPQVFNDSNDTVAALKADRVDAIVVDLPTAFFLSAVEVEGSTIVGQFEAPGGDPWGALLAKDSPLTECVTQAVETLRESGELDRLTQRWIGAKAGAPKLD